MIYGNLLNNLDEASKRNYKLSLSKKILNKKWSVVFNTTCIKNNMLPKYTNYHIYLNKPFNLSLYRINSLNSGSVPNIGSGPHTGPSIRGR